MKIKWDYEAERDIWRALCAPNRWFDEEGNISTHPQSLWYFVKYVWGVEFYFRNHPDQIRWLADNIHGPFLEWLQQHIMTWKENCAKGSPDRYYIASVLPRGFGKTVSATKASMIWAQLDEPDMSTLIASSTSPLTEDILKAIQAVMSGDDPDAWFTWLYGNWRQGSKEWRSNYFVHGARRS